jgi:hypothetical protein
MRKNVYIFLCTAMFFGLTACDGGGDAAIDIGTATFDRTTRDCTNSDESILESPTEDLDSSVTELKTAGSTFSLLSVEDDEEDCRFQWSYNVASFVTDVAIGNSNNDFENISVTADQCATSVEAIVAIAAEAYAKMSVTFSAEGRIARLRFLTGATQCSVFVKE